MNKAILFTKRNIKEMLRDPLIYIFCAGFPIAMVLLFQIILHYAQDKTPIFEVKSLIPGIMVFSYSILMLMSSLLISKDKSTALLKRLYNWLFYPLFHNWFSSINSMYYFRLYIWSNI